MLTGKSCVLYLALCGVGQAPPPVVAPQALIPPGLPTGNIITHRHTVEFPLANWVNTETVRVRLFVSADLGKTWQEHGQQKPDVASFKFHAPRDGEYWFIRQIEQKDGQRVPADPRGAQADLTLVVDSIRQQPAAEQAPQVPFMRAPQPVIPAPQALNVPLPPPVLQRN